MNPGFTVEYDDQSVVNTLPVTEVRNMPLFAALFTSDKGTERWTKVSGADFFKMYGKNISFSKHGQPLLQAAMSINAGAELLCKRLVAENATLANLGIIAEIGTTEVQATNEAGEPLYKDSEDNQTTEVTDTPVMNEVTSVEYKMSSVPNAKDITEVTAALKATADQQANRYLLYVICDNGRGTSKKRIKITPNYRVSKNLEYTSYTLSVIEDTEVIESIAFSVNPNMIANGVNISLYSMINSNSTQLVCADDPSGMEAFISALAEKTGIDESSLYMADPLFGCTNRGVGIKGLMVTNGTDLQASAGIVLREGSNGTFGTHPFNSTEEFNARAVEALNGTFDSEIFNLDQYHITAMIDANYPSATKRAIEALATFREDFMYFRDQGLGVNNMDLVVARSAQEAKNMFCTTYPQSYDIIDPYSKKQITVTIGYDLAQLLVTHWNNGSNLPTAGIKYNMVIKNAIPGTLSFSPTVCPDPIGNQKEMMDDLHINYATYIDNRLVLETLYTSQDKHTQWSYINNVMGIQEVIKAIRIRCPIIRYSFIDGEDLEKYRADVEEILDGFKSNFKVLQLKFVEDATYSQNKIFYAVLQVVYKDFVQSEYFKVTALSSVDVLEG